jgi:hypothetical protein
MAIPTRVRDRADIGLCVQGQRRSRFDEASDLPLLSLYF